MSVLDLTIACAVIAASRALPAPALAGTVLLGELTLGGGLRPAGGVLPMVMAAADRGLRRVVLPEPQAAEGGPAAGGRGARLRSLGQLVAALITEESVDTFSVRRGTFAD